MNDINLLIDEGGFKFSVNINFEEYEDRYNCTATIYRSRHPDALSISYDPSAFDRITGSYCTLVCHDSVTGEYYATPYGSALDENDYWQEPQEKTITFTIPIKLYTPSFVIHAEIRSNTTHTYGDFESIDIKPKLRITYDCNDADLIKYKGNKQEGTLHSEYEYGTTYANGLWDGDNPEWLYCEKKGHKLTGNWSTLPVSDTSTVTYNWKDPIIPEKLLEPLGIDLAEGNKYITLFLEWEKTFIPYVKVGNEFKTGKLYTKTSNGWKEIINVKQF